MYETTYDIIEWKSCASFTEIGTSSIDKYQQVSPPITSGFIGSNSDIVFPTLFHEDNDTETSIVTLPYYGSVFEASESADNLPPDDLGELSVYQKVSNWVVTQKKFFRKEEEPLIEDDDMEVIDPVDLFHESILDEYLVLTEDDSERRAILRDLHNHHYNIETVDELMQTHEYKFIREPKCNVEIELEIIIDYSDNTHVEDVINIPSISSDVERKEENLMFLGVPRLLQNYIILNREGSVIKLDGIVDLWLAPLEEDLSNNSEDNSDSHSDLDFLSSWFSDVHKSECGEVKRSLTFNTDMLTRVSHTVISIGSDDDDLWLDAPEIPDWLEGETEELELFNQPSRPLYYYRDRIKGCYRIIGVEDDTVILFSGNDDDTIFYSEESSFEQMFEQPLFTDNSNQENNVRKTSILNNFGHRYLRIYNRLLYGTKEYQTNDPKNDSGIDEDIDESNDAICTTPISSSYPLSSKDENPSYRTSTSSSKHVSFSNRDSFYVHPSKQPFVECLFVVIGAIVVLITLTLYKNGTTLSRLHRSKTTEEIYDDLGAIFHGVYKGVFI